ncbi:YciI family protein [Frondihabitans australicus]|uniref:YCII-related domain-containing protein n=1 Tax=Frondihabitans australicus TaxID=386892 RepID=A0A495IGT7_9MICO|nr:YciI family protein [Frondihabitans australicus]RKR75233.1 hypothetical protein C8E83_2371 [Frondihabitans australicus]
MRQYLISFPSEAMDITDDELPAVADAAYAWVQEAAAAGVLLFTGGIDEDVAVVTVAGDGTVTDGASFPQSQDLNGGYAVIEVETRDEAVEWARKVAVACRCSQELRVFQDSPRVAELLPHLPR